MITFASDFKEGWQSERSRWTRNPVYPYGYRGFESLTLRNKKHEKELVKFLFFIFPCNLFARMKEKQYLCSRILQTSLINLFKNV